MENLKCTHIKENVKYNQSKGKDLRTICQVCKCKTRHLVIQSVDTDAIGKFSENNEFAFTIEWRDLYQIIQCQGCMTISFREENFSSEDPNLDTDDGTTERLYPRRALESVNIKDFLNVPYNIRRIYRETIDCFNNDIVTLCAAGIRAILEGICQDNKITDGEVTIMEKNGTVKTERKGNLQGKISGLVERGLLTKDDSDILHEHRILGNKALHELSQPSKEELILAIQIIEHIIETIYEIPQKANKLRDIRRKSKEQIERIRHLTADK